MKMNSPEILERINTGKPEFICESTSGLSFYACLRNLVARIEVQFRFNFLCLWAKKSEAGKNPNLTFCFLGYT